MWQRWSAVALGSFVLGVLPALAQDGAGEAIRDGSRVQIEYTLRDDAGVVLDSNKGGAPMSYTQGQNEIPPALERALDGARKGDTKQVTLRPAEAFGEIDPMAETEVPIDKVPADAREVGSQLVARQQDGTERSVRVKAVKEKTIVLDLNHPLAGKTLVFDVTVLNVDPPR